MVATAACEETPRHVTGKKVSKPLMEKKRRARINKCLDQLKNLLESYYSTSIRKRKLEKADILELTVNHLRNLQKIQSCNIAASDLSDYQSGFRRCVADVDRYALMADSSLSASDRRLISQLSSQLWRSRTAEGAISTTDSGPSRAKARHKDSRTQPKASEGTNVAEPPAADASALPCLRTQDARLQSGSPRSRKEAASDNRRPTDQETDSAAHSCANITHMWRPW